MDYWRKRKTKKPEGTKRKGRKKEEFSKDIRKFLLFTDDMIIYLENPKESIKS